MNPAIPPDADPSLVPRPLIPWWQNPGLWAGLLSPAALILNQRFGVHLTGEELGAVATGLVPLIIGLFGQHVQHNTAAMNSQSRMMAASSRNSVG